MTTKRPLDRDELASVLAPIGVPTGTRPLSGGLFAAVDLVQMEDGRAVVVKTGVAASEGRPPLLTYEHDLLRAEAELLRRAEPAAVPTPRVLLTDLSRSLVDVDVLVMDHLPGETWEAVARTLEGPAAQRVVHEWGGALAGFHSLRGEVFGYPSSPALQASAWPDVVTAMFEALLDDAGTWGVDIQQDRIRRALGASLDDVAEITQPVLVHMDLWPGNVLIDPATGAVTGVVDLERGLFGDPVMDLVGAEPMSVDAPSSGLLAGYHAAGGRLPIVEGGGTPFGLEPAADRRLALYRLYMNALMTIEIVPRAYAEDWVPAYSQQLLRNREALLRHLCV